MTLLTGFKDFFHRNAIPFLLPLFTAAALIGVFIGLSLRADGAADVWIRLAAFAKSSTLFNAVAIAAIVLATVFILLYGLTRLERNWWYRELAARLLLPALLACGGAVLGLATTPRGMGRSWAFLVSILGATIGWVADDILRWQNRERRQDEEIRWIREHFEKLPVRFAFHTDNNCLEELLDASEKLVGKTRWLVPMFISQMLSRQISQGHQASFIIGEREYSQMLDRLLEYCSRSIYMTCPYAPVTWFRKLLREDQMAKVQAGTLSEEEFPSHVRKLMNLRRLDRRRFVILPGNAKDEFLNNPTVLQTFLRYSDTRYGIATRFAYQPVLCANCDSLNECGQTSQLDYQVWDRDTVVEYRLGADDEREIKVASGPETGGLCTLRLRHAASYVRLFERCWNYDQHVYTLDEMRQEIERGRGAGQDGSAGLTKWGPDFRFQFSRQGEEDRG